MTREIKFRGKKFCQDEWIYGSLITRGERGADGNFIDTGRGECYPLQQDTVGQFTGLHDKNGKEIYEGDILRKSTFFDNDFTETYLDRDTIGVVRILPSCGTTICNCIVYETDSPYEEKKMKEKIKRAQVVGKRSEVIGNIYDNPELLKGGEQ